MHNLHPDLISRCSSSAREIVSQSETKRKPASYLPLHFWKVNFGSAEGPWNHSQRLEQKFGKRLKIVGLVDPAVARAQEVLDKKKQSIAALAYEGTKIFADVQAAQASLGPDGVHAVIVGCPPAFRGTTDSARKLDIECQLIKAFPQAGFLIEKPVSTASVEETKKVGKILAEHGNTVSVGYMLRYCKAVQMMKQIIAENNLTVMMTSARYVMAYEYSLKVRSLVVTEQGICKASDRLAFVFALAARLVEQSH